MKLSSLIEEPETKLNVPRISPSAEFLTRCDSSIWIGTLVLYLKLHGEIKLFRFLEPLSELLDLFSRIAIRRFYMNTTLKLLNTMRFITHQSQKIFIYHRPMCFSRSTTGKNISNGF